MAARLKDYRFAVLFVILIDHLAHNDEVLRIAKRIQSEIAVPFFLYTHEVFTSMSQGVTFGDREYQNAEDILRDADTALLASGPTFAQSQRETHHAPVRSIGGAMPRQPPAPVTLVVNEILPLPFSGNMGTE